MSRSLRKKARISYFEPEEPSLDEYVFCEKCADYVYEYCSIHGALLVIPDDKVLQNLVILGAGLGVFTTLTLPSGVRFGPYRGERTNDIISDYSWQIYDSNNKPSHVVDASDGNKSNWMRYVNCSRHWSEQNLVAFQYQGELYYRTIKIVPRYTELMVFYGSEYANLLHIDIGKYNSPRCYAQKFGVPPPKKRRFGVQNKKAQVDASKPIGELKDKQENQSNLTSLKTPEAIVEKVKVQEAYFVCNVCNYKTVTKDRLAKHMSFHDINRKFACEYCSYRFPTSLLLNNHKLQHHEIKLNINKLECNICDYTTMLESDLKRHLLKHAELKPYACSECDYKFSEAGSLKRHLRTHTGEKPYACSECDYKCSEASKLKTHLRTHTGEKPYACSKCDYKCSQAGSLKTHLRTHTGEKPYACSECDKKFTQLSDLTRHLRTHTGEKPYACSECDYKCSQTGSLKKHLRTHTGEKPYACSECDYKCSVASRLKRHLRTHSR